MKMKRKVALLLVLVMSLLPLNMIAFNQHNNVGGFSAFEQPHNSHITSPAALNATTAVGLRLYATATDRTTGLTRLMPLDGTTRSLNSETMIWVVAVDASGNRVFLDGHYGTISDYDEYGNWFSVPRLTFVDEWSTSGFAADDVFDFPETSSQRILRIGANTTARTLTLTARLGGLSGTASISIDTAHNATISILTFSNVPQSVAPNTSHGFGILAYDQHGGRIFDVPPTNEFNWAASSSPSANDRIEVDSHGIPSIIIDSSTAHRVITLTATHVPTGTTASTTITVDPTLPSITAGPQVGILRAGMPSQATFNLTTANIAPGQHSASIGWGLPTGLSVLGWNNNAGYIDVGANGEATLTIVGDSNTIPWSTSVDIWVTVSGHSVRATLDITIIPSPQRIEIGPSNSITRAPGSGILTLNANVIGRNASNQDITLGDEDVTWNVSMGSVTGVTQSQAGNNLNLNVGAYATDGDITITATSVTNPNVYATATVTIDQNFVPRINGIVLYHDGNRLLPTTRRSRLSPNDTMLLEAFVVDQHNVAIPNEDVAWGYWTTLDFDTWLDSASNIDTLSNLTGNTVELAISSSKQMRRVHIEAYPLSLAVLGERSIAASHQIDILAGNTELSVANQVGTLTAGTPGSITFPIHTRYMVPSVGGWGYQARIVGLPPGVSAYGFNPSPHINNEVMGSVNISLNQPASTITLIGDETTLAGTTTATFYIWYSHDGTWIGDTINITISSTTAPPGEQTPTPPNGTTPDDNDTTTPQPPNGPQAPPPGGSTPPPWWLAPQSPEAPAPSAVATTRNIPASATSVSVGGVEISTRQSGANVTLTLPTATVNQLIGNANNIINFDLSGKQSATNVIMPTNAITLFTNAGLTLDISLPHVTITLDAAALSNIASQARGANVGISIQPIDMAQLPLASRTVIPAGSEVLRIQISSGGQSITNLGGNMSTSFRFSGVSPAAAWRLNPNHQLELLESTFDNQTNAITFNKNRLSIFVIGSDPNFSGASTVGFATLHGTSNHSLRLSIRSVVFTSMGNVSQSDVAPFIDPANNRTMVPLRLIAEEGLGATVRFEESTSTVFINHNGRETTLSIGNPLPDGMGTPIIQNSRTFVPLRYVADVLGVEVRWDETTRAVYVY